MPESVLALIPARAGSKRLPGKNLLPLAGKPLIAWTIAAAKRARTVTRTVVTTEDEGIAACAREHGAEVPVMRPAAMAQDDSPGMDPLLHMIEWLAQHEAYRPEIVVVLQPTSPLRTAADIDDAIALMTTTGVPSIVSVTSIGAPAAWLRTVTANRRLTRPVMADDDLYVLNGAIYAARTEVILATRQMDDGAPAAYVMPRERSIDIDTAADLRLAEALLGQGE